MIVQRLVLFLIALALACTPLSAQSLSVERIATGLENPRGVAIMPDGRLIVIEAGTGVESADPAHDSGKLSILTDHNDDGDFDDAGEIERLFSHLPSYNALTTFGTLRDEVGGPGDVVLLEDGRLFFTYEDPFELVAVVEVSPQGRNVGTLIERDATLNALAYDASTATFYVVESGWNRLMAVSAAGEARIVAEFGPLDHGQQAVPAGLAQDPTTGDLLVALFSGQVIDYYGGTLPFMPGDAKIVRVDPTSGRVSDEISGLTTAVDVAVDEQGNRFVVELTSVWPTAPLPRNFDLHDAAAAPDPGGYARYTGRVTMYPADGSAARRLAEGLDAPSNITYHAGTLYVSTGQGTPGRRVLTPHGLNTISGAIYTIRNFRP